MNEKPYLELPQLKLSVGMASFDPAEVREMRDKYEARIRELTEWRPMEKLPESWFLGRCKGGGHCVVREFPDGGICDHTGTLRDVIGWLPLPKVSRG